MIVFSIYRHDGFGVVEGRGERPGASNPADGERAAMKAVAGAEPFGVSVGARKRLQRREPGGGGGGDLCAATKSVLSGR